jgi:hypothetical protein
MLVLFYVDQLGKNTDISEKHAVSIFKVEDGGSVFL